MTGPLTTSQPYPAAQVLPADYARHQPSPAQLRSAITALTAEVDWARLSWRQLIEALLACGRTDIPLARLVEGHVDALRILSVAGRAPVSGALYGVWASRSQQTGVSVRSVGGEFRLDGTLRFASGAGVIDRALIPAWPDADHHLLLDLPVAQWPADGSGWVTGAMAVSRSHTVTVEDVAVGVDAQVGDLDFYLSRPGFFPGGVGVAACWAGGAARVVDRLVARMTPPLSPSVRARLGRIRTDLVAAAAALRGAADRLDATLPRHQPMGHEDWQALATETRAVVADAVTRILEQARRVAGPAGLALDEDLTRARADLDLYVLQQSADGDAAVLGERTETAC